MTLQYRAGPTILAAASLSAGINIATVDVLQLVGILMPPAWDGDILTFQWSFDGATYYDVFDRDGKEVWFSVVPSTVVAAATAYSFYVMPWMKFRSGPRSGPIPQTADRTFATLVQ